jgi:alpha-N-arabinofuranosidase
MRDGLLAGLTLDTFNRHADKVAMANVAQLINCLHALFIAHEDQFVVTPNYHVFEMYAAHQGNRSLRMMVDAPAVSYSRVGKPATFWGLQGSASLGDKTLIVTLVNPHVSETRETAISLRGATIKSAQQATFTRTTALPIPAPSSRKSQRSQQRARRLCTSSRPHR